MKKISTSLLVFFALLVFAVVPVLAVGPGQYSLTTILDGSTPVGTSHPLPVSGVSGADIGAKADAASVDPTTTTTSLIGITKGELTELVAIAANTKPKGTNVALFGGAISASVNEATSTVIDMRGYTGGSLDVLVNSGTGTFSLAIMTSETGTGVFHQMYIQKSDGSGQIAYPAIVTIASTSTSFSIPSLKANYIKLVPTLTGTANVTFTFTPSSM